MFITLLAVTFAIAVAASYTVIRLFQKPIAAMLDRIIGEDVSEGHAVVAIGVPELEARRS